MSKSNGTPTSKGTSTSKDTSHPESPANGNTRRLAVSFRRSGDLDRDMFRLRELYECIRDPRGRDQFVIQLDSKGEAVTLTFPDDLCTINERLTRELVKHFRVDVKVEE